MPDGRVLVVGTTPDYIAHIQSRYPGRALFLTDLSQRRSSPETPPRPDEELLCDLLREDQVWPALADHLVRNEIELTGIVCYDCEWLTLAARLANRYRLPYPSQSAMRLSRSKLLTKRRWHEVGVPCPDIKLVASSDDALSFAHRTAGPVVLKPLTGSGSELTFCCDNRSSVLKTMRVIAKGLAQRGSLAMYRQDADDYSDADPRQAVMAEAYVRGNEYSADFAIADGVVTVVRVARKYRSPDLPFGITTAYEIPAPPSELKAWPELPEIFRLATESLGITRALCMVDFIMTADGPMLIELTPRIGGDCIPQLVDLCCGLDTIGLALDFAEGNSWTVPPPEHWRALVGRRFFGGHNGRLESIDVSRLQGDSRTKTISLRRSPGHRVTMPPADYDSWLLGHFVFSPASRTPIAEQADQLAAMIKVTMEKEDDRRQLSRAAAGR